MIIFNKDTEKNGKKDRAQDVRIDSLQSAVDELNADIAEIEITVENLSQSIDDKYAAQTQSLMSKLNTQIQSLISNLEDFINTNQINADVGNFKNLYATVLSNLKNLTVDYASVTQSATIAAATITSETVISSQIQTLQAVSATISDLTATLLHITNLAVTNLMAEKVTADEVDTDLAKADESRSDLLKVKNITGKGWQTPIGTPDNTELLKITIPHYEGVIQLVTEDNEFSVTVIDNALIAWSEESEYLFRVQKNESNTELYLQNIGDSVNYQLVQFGSTDTVTSISEIVDKTGIRQNVLTLNGVYGVGSEGSGGGVSILFVDTVPAEGEEGVIYINANTGAWVWNEDTGTMIPLTGTELRTAVQNNTTHIGTLTDLTTTAGSDLVSAINEVHENEGDLTTLTTTAKTNLVGAINEVDSHADTNAGAIATINGNDTGLSMREVAQDVTANVYIPCGSVTFANLPALSGLRIGDVYNVTDAFTTTADFVEGAGISVPAGSNVVVVDNNNVKKWDVLGSLVDISAYYTKTETNALLDDKTDLTVIAPEFSTSATYAVGDYVIYDGKFYQCTTAHSAGAWSSSDFTEKTLSELASQTGFYMAYTNPVGEGRFSMNRMANSTSGQYSATLGRDCTADGECGIASGYRARARGQFAHAENYFTFAEGRSSHAEGEYTNAGGNYSHAEGAYTYASGNYSHAEGAYTSARENQHVQGRYNVLDNSTAPEYADIIGNGIDADNRKNIEATTWTGDKRLKGTVYVGCNDDSTGGIDLRSSFMCLVSNSSSVTGPQLQTNFMFRVMFTADNTALDGSTAMQISYNGTSYTVKVNKNGALADVYAHNPSGTYKYLQAYTVIDFVFDGTNLIIVGNPILLSSTDYTIYADGSVGNEIIGTIKPYYKNSEPYGWLKCDGRTISNMNTKYPNLYSFLGNLNVLPDLRECTLKMIGINPNGASSVKTGGLAIGEFMDDRLQNHQHYYGNGDSDVGLSDYSAYYKGAAVVGSTGVGFVTNTVTDASRAGATTEVKAVGVNFIIKAL